MTGPVALVRTADSDSATVATGDGRHEGQFCGEVSQGQWRQGWSVMRASVPKNVKACGYSEKEVLLSRPTKCGTSAQSWIYLETSK
ncbi:hypothetical protein JG688_00005024 [Phytophthora aleatoria]|uniref:Uncharacterized protein n=1 Tax=Phytophthora aleatoria TaxID=2496075 RepID=A0A8J5ISC9_9STRA|nr:hypothetical protein JG688_00005024 [Phytophthora aleatoria]